LGRLTVTARKGPRNFARSTSLDRHTTHRYHEIISSPNGPVAQESVVDSALLRSIFRPSKPAFLYTICTQIDAVALVRKTPVPWESTAYPGEPPGTRLVAKSSYLGGCPGPENRRKSKDNNWPVPFAERNSFICCWKMCVREPPVGTRQQIG
jgi:hypothetical protein